MRLADMLKSIVTDDDQKYITIPKTRKDRFLKIMFNHLRSLYWVKAPSSSVLKKHKCEDIWKDNKKTFHQNGD